MGSKNRYAKYLLPHILKERVSDEQYVVDLFAGGFNLIDKVSGNRIANDINYYLIELFKALQNDWIPPKFVSEEFYKEVQNNKDKHEPYLVGYIGFNLSYGAKFFGGYRRDSMGKRNYSLEAYNNIMKQIPNIKGIELYNMEYYKVPIPPNSIIYCDIPYYGTTKYQNTNHFDYLKFYEYCKIQKQKGHKIFISEYYMPEEFICLWSKEVNNSLTKNTGSKKGIEKLFTI